MDFDLTSEQEDLVDLFRYESVKDDATVERYSRAVRQWLDYLANPGRQEFDSNYYDREPKTFEADTGTLKRYLQALLEDAGYAPSTVDTRRAAISVFYQELEKIRQDTDIPVGEDWDEIDNPSEGLDPTNTFSAYSDSEMDSDDSIKYLKPIEVKKLVDNVPSPKPRNELIIKLLFHTGMRRGELINVKLSHVDFDARHIEVQDTKNNQTRDAYYPPVVGRDMNRWVNVRRESLATADSDYLFPTNRSEQISPQRVNDIVKIAAENAGLQEPAGTDQMGRDISQITAHTLRHSCAMAMLMNVGGKRSADLQTIKENLGHSDLETTQIYLDIAEDDLENRIRNTGTPDLGNLDE